MRGTHTCAVLEVSKSAWDEIAVKLREAGYDHAFSLDGKTIDMHGIGLEEETRTMTNLERRAAEWLRINRPRHAVPMKVGETICLRPVMAPFGKAGEYEKPIESLEETYDRVVITQEMLDSIK